MMLSSMISMVLYLYYVLGVSSLEIGGIVQTSSGSVKGHPAKNKTQVSEYLGIPYAAPAVGNLRFAAPVAKPKERGIIDTTKYVSLSLLDSKGGRAHSLFKDIS
jgi:Carboxylesterase family